MTEDRATAARSGTIEIGDDIVVHRLGFGAMRITGNGIIGDPPDREEAKRVLRRVVELGVELIDTADSYGPEVSENLIREALHPYPQNVVIATKGGLLRPGPGQWNPDGRPEHLREACEGSLRRLAVDTIDLYQFHRPDPKVPIEESLGEIALMQQEGKIRHVGVSNVTEDQLRRAQSVTTVVSVQNRYNVADRTSDAMVDLCEKEGLAFLPYAPILDIDKHGAVSQIASRHGAEPRQVVLAWLLARSASIVPIPGTGSVSHAEQNVAAAGIVLDDEEIEAITRRAA
jgi:pyridoxine 4-dehydrogenase